MKHNLLNPSWLHCGVYVNVTEDREAFEVELTKFPCCNPSVEVRSTRSVTTDTFELHMFCMWTVNVVKTPTDTCEQVFMGSMRALLGHTGGDWTGTELIGVVLDELMKSSTFRDRWSQKSSMDITSFMTHLNRNSIPSVNRSASEGDCTVVQRSVTR